MVDIPAELREAAEPLLAPTPLNGREVTALEASVWKGSFSLVYNDMASAMSTRLISLLRQLHSFVRNIPAFWQANTDILGLIGEAEFVCLPAQPEGLTKLEMVVKQGDSSAQSLVPQAISILRRFLALQPVEVELQFDPSPAFELPRSEDQSDESQLDPQELHAQAVLWQKQIRLRIVAVLKLWLRDFWSDFESNSRLIYMLLYWLQAPLTVKFSKTVCDSLTRTLMNRLTSGPKDLHAPTSHSIALAHRRMGTLSKDQFPPTLIPRDTLKAPPEDLDPFSIDHTELARQISLCDQSLFQAIEPKELLNQNWNRPGKQVTAPHVSELVAQVNAIASWVMNSIVCQSNRKVRVRRIEKWIRIAISAKEMSNFNAVMTILSGLGGTAVYRLRRTWAKVEPTLQNQLDELKTLMSPTQNYAAYRTLLRSINPPCVPYIGCVLTDLTFTDDAMSDYRDEASTVINFHKRLQTAMLIEGLLNFRFPSYGLHPVGFIQSHLRTKWTDPTKLASGEVLIAISRVLEPS